MTVLDSDSMRFAIALCPPDAAAQLLPYTQHSVWVQGRQGVLVAYPYLSPAELTQPVEFQVVFQHVAGHPAAPPEAQAIIDGLNFEPIS